MGRAAVPTGRGTAGRSWSNGELSDFGHEAVAAMNRVGVTLDMARSRWQTNLDAAQVSSKPIVVSHTTCSGLHPHILSKPDDVIRAIAATGD